ncbi:hypothetical protein ACJIZ3_018534 [Penstemon smallii]|uniref:Uncharacterized protein n=1 Tax=Penstemon smallii TaxID=265156 RepID=A0ABD3T029_9LAMI
MFGCERFNSLEISGISDSMSPKKCRKAKLSPSH